MELFQIMVALAAICVVYVLVGRRSSRFAEERTQQERLRLRDEQRARDAALSKSTRENFAATNATTRENDTGVSKPNESSARRKRCGFVLVVQSSRGSRWAGNFETPRSTHSNVGNL